MTFLKLNGVTIPIAKGGSHTAEVAGNMIGQAYNGTPMHDRRARFRKWQFETNRLVDRDAEGVIGMVMGRGQHFPFLTDHNSSKGLLPTGTPVSTIVPGIDLQTSPAKVYLESTGIEEAKFWGGSLVVAPATTNLLPADSRDAENAPTGYTVYAGSTLSAETAIVLQGTKSLKITTSATLRSGCYVTYTGTVGTDKHTGSVYVYTTEALSMRMLLLEVGGGSAASAITWTSTPGVWELVEATITCTSGTGIRIYLQHDDTIAGKVIYADQWQIEEQSAATPWADGARAAPDLEYKGITDLSDSLTFACWTRGPTANPAANATLFYAANTALTNIVTFRRDSGTNNIKLQLGSESQAGSENWSDTSIWDDDWHHVAFVLSARAGGISRIVDLYFDGVRVDGDSDGTVYYPELRGKVSTCYVGNNAGSATWDAPIQEVLVLPYAMSGDQIADLAARTRNMPPLPQVDAQGKFNAAVDDDTRDYNFPVQGEVTGVKYEGKHDGSGWRNDARRVSFTLRSIDEA